MADIGIGSDQHAALTKQYGDYLDQLQEVIRSVLNSVTDATTSGIVGDFSKAWRGVAQDVTTKGMKTQATLKQLQDLLGTGRQGYVSTEADNTRTFTNLP